MRLTYADTTHRYHLDGKAVKSASAVAKIAADDFALQQWQQRMVAVGMTLEPRLAERVAVDLTNREAIQKVVEDAHEAARANAAADRGTQRHRVLELSLLGRQDQFVTDQQRADAAVLERTLDRYGLEPIPERVEQFVVWPQVPVVGRYDCVLGYNGAPAMFDLKSGRSAVDYPHSTVTQLALYAYAPRTSRTLVQVGDKWSCDDWTTMPDGLDLDTGYVILVGDDDEVGTLYALDLKHGLEAAKWAMELVTWRRAHNYGRDLAHRIEAPAPPSESDGSEHDDRREALRRRYLNLADAHQEAFRALHVPPDDLDAVERGLDSVDPFMTTHIAPVAPAPPVPARPPAPHSPDEGGRVGDDERDALRVRYDALDVAAQVWANKIVADAKVNLGTFQTRRRADVYTALLTLAEHAYDDDEVLRPLVWAVSGRDDAVLFANVTVGAAIGVLGAPDTARLAVLAAELVANRLGLIVDPITKGLYVEPLEPEEIEHESR